MTTRAAPLLEQRGHAARRSRWRASPGVPTGPNPRVGCVLLDPQGDVVAEGWHRGAGSPHAEVDALPARRRRPLAAPPRSSRSSPATTPAAPARAPGRWSRPAYAAWSTPSATPTRSRPGERPPCATPGVEVEGGLLEDEARAVNRVWTFAMDHGRPFVTWKFATTLDGRSAAADGTSRWVSSRAARIDTHRLRALCDTMLVGTNTVDVDDPLLTVRDADDRPLPRPAAARRDGSARPARRPPGVRRLGTHRPPAHPRPAARAQGAVRARPAARLPRGRPDPGRGVLEGRPRRRGRHVRRPDAARLRPHRPWPTSASAPSPTPPT